jgi:site-specific recombinase XerD
MAAATWPNLTGKFKPHDDRHSHATWLDAADLHKVVQMDRRGHAMPGMDAIYTHVTLEMRQRLCDTLEELWQHAVAQRYELATSSSVPLLNQILAAYRARRTR